MRGNSIPKETFGFAEGKETLFGGMCGQDVRVGEDSEKVVSMWDMQSGVYFIKNCVMMSRVVTNHLHSP